MTDDKSDNKSTEEEKKSTSLGEHAMNTGRAIGNLGEKAVDTGIAIGNASRCRCLEYHADL